MITPLKERFPYLFNCSLSKESWIFDLIVSALEGEVGARIFNSIELLRIGSKKMFVLSLSLCIPLCQGMRRMIL